MEPEITVFIDEGGDPGVKDGLKWAKSRYEWFTLGAYVVRTSDEPLTIDTVKKIQDGIKGNQRADLHYAYLTETNRLMACAALAEAPGRGFCIASHKTNLRSYENEVLGRLKFAEYYNWCARLLFERIMFWYERQVSRGRLSVAPMRIIFSERGGHDYDKMFAYLFETLPHQANHKTLKKPAKCYNPLMLDRSLASVYQHNDNAGLQLADVIASSFFQAANTMSPKWALEPAKAMSKIIARSPPTGAMDVGLTAWPLHFQGTIPKEAQPIFAHYGYKFR